MTDVIAALRLFLSRDVGVTLLVNARVFATELPKEEMKDMPRKSIVLVYAGGVERNCFLPIAGCRIDVWSYGETYHEAGRVDRVVYDVLKALDRQTVGNVLLHGVALSGGPFSVREGRSGWPAQWRSVSVSADEREIS